MILYIKVNCLYFFADMTFLLSHNEQRWYFFLCLAGPGVVELSDRQTLMGITLGAMCSYWVQLSLFKLEKQVVTRYIK